MHRMAHLQRVLTQHSSANLKNGIHISRYYMSLLRISTHYDYPEASQQASDVQQQQHCVYVQSTTTRRQRRQFDPRLEKSSARNSWRRLAIFLGGSAARDACQTVPRWCLPSPAIATPCEWLVISRSGRYGEYNATTPIAAAYQSGSGGDAVEAIRIIINRPAAAKARSWRRLRRGDGCPAAVAPGH